MPKTVVLTGAFSYTGGAVAGELLARGYSVRTLTNRTPPEGLHGGIESAPLVFDLERLSRFMEGADVFINTFWVRLPYAGVTFDSAVEHSRLLFQSAKQAGVRKIVHVSVSNAECGGNLGYYRGKAEVEKILKSSGLPYAIVRPTLILGTADVLTNNMAWMLRRFPLFALPRGGNYRLQPITLRDTARIIAMEVENTTDSEMDAAGPEIFTFKEFLGFLAESVGSKSRFLSVPNGVALASLRPLEWVLRDIILTREELLGLQQELLVSHRNPLGKESVLQWLKAHGKGLGHRFSNDLNRHFLTERQSPIIS